MRPQDKPDGDMYLFSILFWVTQTAMSKVDGHHERVYNSTIKVVGPEIKKWTVQRIKTKRSHKNE